ncbi:hypothetical protein AB1K84_20770 [Mesobacillus foraminis]|uniref:Uncharacterized protein n=1 Tax=Mesobacillus foraminis TaxID=279826 RepID=A0A4R2B0H0_9BACI|nr:hypothetical protein [Mesobacillus foraminis]TCN19917.1 hypothetical protein EV146_11587 [Mesobacillus foraminis]
MQMEKTLTDFVEEDRFELHSYLNYLLDEHSKEDNSYNDPSL